MPYEFTIDNYAKMVDQRCSEFYVVFTMILCGPKLEWMFRPVLFIVRAGVAKNTKIQCTIIKLLTQPVTLATCQKVSILSDRRSV